MAGQNYRAWYNQDTGLPAAVPAGSGAVGSEQQPTRRANQSGLQSPFGGVCSGREINGFSGCWFCTALRLWFITNLTILESASRGPLRSMPSESRLRAADGAATH